MKAKTNLLLTISVLLLLNFVKSQTTTLTVIVQYNGLTASGNMFLRGDGLGLNWNSGEEMAQISSTEWQISLTFSSSDVGTQLQLKPLINDNSWSIGANFQTIIPKDSSSVTLYPWFHTYQGKYSIVGSLYSPQLNNTRDIIVYTPPSYYENTLKYQTNVLIMHDGQNLFNASTSYAGVAWDCQDTVNSYVVQGLMEEVLIVGVYNTPDRIDEYTYSYDPCYTTNIRGDCVGGGGKGDLYLDFLVEEVIPFVKDMFRIDTERSNMGIMGSSLGGLISCYGAWTRPSVWQKGGCMSSSFWWNYRDFNNVILDTYPKPDDEKIYLDSGNCCPEPIGDDHYVLLPFFFYIQI